MPVGRAASAAAAAATGGAFNWRPLSRRADFGPREEHPRDIAVRQHSSWTAGQAAEARRPPVTARRRRARAPARPVVSPSWDWESRAGDEPEARAAGAGARARPVQLCSGTRTRTKRDRQRKDATGSLRTMRQKKHVRPPPSRWTPPAGSRTPWTYAAAVKREPTRC